MYGNTQSLKYELIICVCKKTRSATWEFENVDVNSVIWNFLINIVDD